MFIILLNYIKLLSEVDQFASEYKAFLEINYAAGHFLLSGRKEPRTGGIILSKAETKAEIESIVQKDPFHREKIAEYEIIEFLPTMATAPLSFFKAA